MAQVTGVHGTELCETYLVNIGLPNKVMVTSVRVTKAKLVHGADILIGMNIITQGDFAVTNYRGLTKFSFPMPSQAHIDFNMGAQARSARPQFANAGRAKSRSGTQGGGGGKAKGRKKKK